MNIPYGKQYIDDNDIKEVISVLKSDYLTTGPYVSKFENKIAKLSNRNHAVAVSNGTAALHCALFALNLKKDDEIIVPAISFIASSNCALYMGLTVKFCDVDKETLCIDVDKIENMITKKTKCIIAVDFAGQLCDYKKLNYLKQKYGFYLITDAAHSLGLGKYTKNIVDMITYSFHPVKHITTGEGGMITTDNKMFYKKLKLFRSHGIDVEYKNRIGYNYDMIELGYNYRLTDIQSALGISQLKKLKFFIKKRIKFAKKYNFIFSNNFFINKIKPLINKNKNVYHLYIIKILKGNRDNLYTYLKKKGINVNVHYKPIYLHSYYQSIGYNKNIAPISEDVYKNILTLPLFPTLTEKEFNYIINNIKNYYINLDD